MFPFSKSKTMKRAKDFLSMASKVYNYRHDLIPENDREQMRYLIDKVEILVHEKKYDTKDFDTLENTLEPLMKKYGGKIYPVTFLSDNVETIIVAGILAISIRSFFLQPFKIPTNSMYPSFYGMTAEVYDEKNKAPTAPEKVWNFIIKNASNYSVKAPASGEVLIPLSKKASYSVFASTPRSYNWLGFWPSYENIFSFYVDGKSVDLSLPADFSIESVLMKAFPIAGAKTLNEYIKAIRDSGKIVEKNGVKYLSLGQVEKGNYIVNFDILGGDMLLVDRFTYNFRKPQVGEPIVFLTKYCDGLTAMRSGVPDDKYYIKRLVGQGGDTLHIEDSTLFRNGKPIEGSHAFAKNFAKEGLYCGYVADGALAEGKKVTIPENHYYAMGDNSENSLDSRYWGMVPKEAFVGKSLVIIYPFTSRCGATK